MRVDERGELEHAKGSKLQQQGSDLTRARIDLAVSKWSAADRARFAKLFEQFVSGMLR